MESRWPAVDRSSPASWGDKTFGSELVKPQPETCRHWSQDGKPWRTGGNVARVHQNHCVGAPQIADRGEVNNTERSIN